LPDPPGGGPLRRLTARQILCESVLHVSPSMAPADLGASAEDTEVFAVLETVSPHPHIDSLVGLVMASDIGNFSHMRFADLLTTPLPEVVDAGCPVKELIRRLEMGGHRAVPVSDSSGMFLGVITCSGISNHLLRLTTERRGGSRIS